MTKAAARSWAPTFGCLRRHSVVMCAARLSVVLCGPNWALNDVKMRIFFLLLVFSICFETIPPDIKKPSVGVVGMAKNRI